MRLRVLLCLVAGLGPSALAQVDVGSGAPNETVRLAFLRAYFRNGFNTLTEAAVSEVRRFGTTGYVQEFSDVSAPASGRLALIRSTGDASASVDVYQVTSAGMYSYYSSIGPGTAGYPITDTQPCPAMAANTCSFQLFDRNYVLFAYQFTTENGQNFATRNPFFTRWSSLGAITVLGAATSAETSVTSPTAVVATAQTFTGGALYNITSGTLSGRLFAVLQPIYNVYVAGGGPTGSLGLPTGDETTLANGRKRQNFERGTIEYEPGTEPALRYPVNSILLSITTKSLRMNLGETLAVTARTFVSTGLEVKDRAITWSTSNGRVVTVTGSGANAVVKAVGGGSAVVTAVSETKTSSPLSIFVVAPCCSIGEGAPNGTIAQAFQDAITRNRLAVRLPAASPVRRSGPGYIQEFVGADTASGVRYLIAKPDRLATAYAVTGVPLVRYEELGGTAGALGYPMGDATAAGRQLFENSAALAGAPVRLVTGGILAKWASLGYESGPAGLPTGDAAQFSTFTAATGLAQSFQGGVIYYAQAGGPAGKCYFVSGLTLAKLLAAGGVAGALGMPTSDEFLLDGQHRQEFEGGVIEYTAGDAEARVTERPRRPSVTATPASAPAGGRVRIAVGGFEAGRTLRISLSGQPDFTVQTATGAFGWEYYLPLDSRTGSVTVRAAEVGGTASAEGSFVVRSTAEAGIELVRVQGDSQTGAPGATLAQPLRVRVRDSGGTPIVGAKVIFTPSPGAQVSASSARTDEAGEGETTLRLPVSLGVALMTAEALGKLTTFSARAGDAVIRSFPRFTQAIDAPLAGGPATIAQKGALLASAASLVRYYQNRSEVPAPNGLADPLTLNQFLGNFCVFDARGGEICDGFLTAGSDREPLLNLWRLSAFTGNAVEISAAQPSLDRIRDLLAQDQPVLVALALTSGEAAAGAHWVVAIGFGSGGIQIHDPNPNLNRSTLDEYLQGFTAGSRAWKGTLTGIARLIPRPPATPGFLVAIAGGTPEVTSAAGACGGTLEVADRAATGLDTAASPVGSVRFRFCDAAQSLYQLDVTSQGAYTGLFTDLGNPGFQADLAGGGGTSYAITRVGAQWQAAAQTPAFRASAVVNAASFTPALAPGGLMAIFGSGLARSGQPTAVEMGGLPATVVSASPFQVNAEIPPGLPPGECPLRLMSPYGVASDTVVLSATAPAIFQIDTRRGAVVNQDGSLNSLVSPARRGQALVVYGTGFGAVERQGSLTVVSNRVTAMIQGQELPVAFAGLTPGFVGLYQVNITLPTGMAPGSDLALYLQQGQTGSNSVVVAIQ